MKINGTARRSIFVNNDGWSVDIIDQQLLPHHYQTLQLTTLEQAAAAIKDMQVRGAPLLSLVGAYGICLALRANPTQQTLNSAYDVLLATRPTAVNLRWALDAMRMHLAELPDDQLVAAAYAKAATLCDEDAELCATIGQHGLDIIRKIAAVKPDGAPVNILTHCNAGWLATVDWGTALAPIYMAHDAGIKVHVWVDETRPRNQGAALTAYELAQHGVPHTVIVDNAGGLFMQRGQVDMCIVGCDRVAANGDVCNKVGTYLKALAAHDNGVPFYVALPYTTFDPLTPHGGDIHIEERGAVELTHATGLDAMGQLTRIRQLPEGTPVANPGFDITPARYITAYITDRGLLTPAQLALRFADKAA